MTRKEFNDLLEELRTRGSELDDVEVKEASSGTPNRIWESVSALANRIGGGTIIFGLSSDDFSWIGVKDVDELQKAVANSCSEMDPPIRPKMMVFSEEGRRVLLVQIPECPREHKPCHYKPSGLPSGAFIRVGDGDRRMTSYEIQSQLAERGQPKEDSRPATEAGLDAINRTAVEVFFARMRERNPEARYLQATTDVLMKKFSIITEIDGEMRPTLCGLLMFSDYPQEFYPNLCATFVRYAGPRDSASKGLDTIIDNKKVEGPLPVLLETLLSAIQRSMRKGTLKSGLLSEDIWEYPQVALREVVVNALAHRDYGPWAMGTQVQIKMYSDAIIIQSPGGLYGPVSEDTLDEVNIQATRNSFLMKLLEGAGIVENRGTGVPTMIAQLARAGLPPPKFKDERTYFRAIFSNETLLDEGTVAWLNTLADHALNERQRKGLAYLRRYRSIRNKDYSRLNNCDSRLATLELAELREADLVVQLGVRGGAIYRLAVPSHKIKPSIAGSLRARHKKILSSFMESPVTPLTARQLAERSDMNLETARIAVKELVKMGALKPTQEKARSVKQSYLPTA